MRAPPRTSLVGIEAGTSGLKLLLAGFEMFPSLVKKLLVEKGIVDKDAKDLLAEQRWFPLESWLAVHEVIYREMGPSAIMAIGTRMSENPHFPPGIRDIPSALDALDIVFHRSHRKLGVVMYDQDTGQMAEGIGHVRTRHIPGRQRVDVTIDSPYACYVDLSILNGIAQKFERTARVEHALGDCRQRGDASCTYTVTW
jgi:hypothetical protein